MHVSRLGKFAGVALLERLTASLTAEWLWMQVRDLSHNLPLTIQDVLFNDIRFFIRVLNYRMAHLLAKSRSLKDRTRRDKGCLGQTKPCILLYDLVLASKTRVPSDDNR